MGWFDNERETHEQVFQDGEVSVPEEHKSKFTHELLAGGVAWEGTRLMEQHLRKEGRQIDHPEAMAIGAGLLGGAVDKVAEGWGMNEVEKMKLHHESKERMQDMYTDHYQNNQGAGQYDPNLPPPPGMGGGYGGGGGDGYGGGGGGGGGGGYGGGGDRY